MVIGGTVSDDSTNEWLALDKKVMTLIVYSTRCLEAMGASCPVAHTFAISSICVPLCSVVSADRPAGASTSAGVLLSD